MVKLKLPPYCSGEMLDLISSVKEEVLLNINTMSIQVEYKLLHEMQALVYYHYYYY